MADSREPSPLPTPTGSTTPNPFGAGRSKYLMSSFENLVALANHQERLREARRMVWRDKGEPVAELDDYWQCAEHAVRGGVRAGALAFSIRASINLLLALARMKSIPNNVRLRLIQHAVFGSDPFRFAAMLGSFVTIYKYLINALPLLFPTPTTKSSRLPRFRLDEDIPTTSPTPTDSPNHHHRRHQAHLSLSAEAHQILVRKKTRRWHAVLAGGLAGGLAIMCEKEGRRNNIAQQLFVRGLQGSYNAFTTRHNIHIPHGEVLVFGLACGQILYAFLVRPETLDRGYQIWLTRAGNMPPPVLNINRSLVREGTFDPADMQKIIDMKGTTAKNGAILTERLSKALALVPDYGPRYAPCAGVHPTIDSCVDAPTDRFIAVVKWMLPIYGALHLVPNVLFKRENFKRQPGKVLMRAIWGAARSSSFLGVLVVIYQSFYCSKHNLHSFLTSISPSSTFKLPQALIDVLISKFSFGFGGALCALSLLVEERRRRGELAMYVLPKALESAWLMARGKGWVFKTGEFGEMILTAIGMAMVMSTYQNDPQHLSGLVRRILYQFIGPN